MKCVYQRNDGLFADCAGKECPACIYEVEEKEYEISKGNFHYSWDERVHETYITLKGCKLFDNNIQPTNIGSKNITENKTDNRTATAIIKQSIF